MGRRSAPRSWTDAEARRLYEGGMSGGQLAAQFGCQRRDVYKAIRRAGGTVRRQSVQKTRKSLVVGGRPVSWTLSEAQEARRLYDVERMSLVTLEAAVGRSRETIRAMILAAGGTMRTRTECQQNRFSWTMEEAMTARQMREEGETMHFIEGEMGHSNKVIRAMILAAGGEISKGRPRRNRCPRCTALVAPGVELCADCIEEMKTPMYRLIRRASPTARVIESSLRRIVGSERFPEVTERY